LSVWIGLSRAVWIPAGFATSAIVGASVFLFARQSQDRGRR
jgi:hypothetical protein